MPLSVTSMLKKFQREKEKKGRQKLRRAQKGAGAPTIPLCPVDGGGGLTDPLLSLIGSTNEQVLIQAASAVDLDIDLDSLLEASEGAAAAPPEPQLSPPKSDDFPQAPPPDAPRPHQTSANSPHQFVCLPGGVPPGLAAAIDRLAAVRLFLFKGFSANSAYADDVLLFARLPGRQRGNRNSSSSHRRSTPSCWSELSSRHWASPR